VWGWVVERAGEWILGEIVELWAGGLVEAEKVLMHSVGMEERE